MKILISGFKAFNNESINPSLIIANKLKEVNCYKIETRLKNYLLKLNRKAKENYKNMANKLINNIENDLSFNDIKELYRLKVE